MVVVLKKKQVQAPPQTSKFTKKDVEELYKIDNWAKWIKQNETKFWANNLDIYEWPIYPCVTQDSHNTKFYHCVLHPTVKVNTGTKINDVSFRNINYEELIWHCVFYEPEEHKSYIMKKLFGS